MHVAMKSKKKGKKKEMNKEPMFSYGKVSRPYKRGIIF